MTALWIAFRFCIFVLWTQYLKFVIIYPHGCELLSDFVYSFFEHNTSVNNNGGGGVVNCFQILYIRSLNTIAPNFCAFHLLLWIAFRFCIFVLWTQLTDYHRVRLDCCELLSDFVYSFFEHNVCVLDYLTSGVVNCFQILYIRSLNTIDIPLPTPLSQLWIAFRFCIFVLWTQSAINLLTCSSVVNCFQILYIRSLNTIDIPLPTPFNQLWIAFRFCIFVLWTQ